MLRGRLPNSLQTEPVNATVSLLGSAAITSPPQGGNWLGLYMHRLTIDPHGRTRTFPRTPGVAEGASELPVNLHFLLIASSTSAVTETDLMAWAMLELANFGQLDVSHLGEQDRDWGFREIINISPDEMSTEDLMRIWDAFESPYRLSVPYVARTVRLKLHPHRSEAPDVITRVFPGGVE